MSSASRTQVVVERVRENIEIGTELATEDFAAGLDAVGALITQAFRSGGKLLLFGNGGSAADAQHIAAEFVGRYRRERPALPALALTTNTSILTAVANDYGYARVFARQVEGLGRAGDVAVALSTSGVSENVIEGVRAARQAGLTTVGMTGRGGGPLADEVDLCLRAPSSETPRIQEAHILMSHIVCELVEDEMFGAAAESDG